MKAVRKNTKPSIWRRAIIPSNITFAQLAVILEKILEFKESDQLEFQFYSEKERILEWHENRTPVYDYNYTYLNAPDTYINPWMEAKCAFSFYITSLPGGAGNTESQPEYRIEVEKILESYYTEDSGNKISGKSPLIAKEVRYEDDLYWSDANAINNVLRTDYYLKKGACEYASFGEIQKQIRQRRGICYSEIMENRDIHTRKSIKRLLGESFGDPSYKPDISNQQTSSNQQPTSKQQQVLKQQQATNQQASKQNPSSNQQQAAAHHNMGNDDAKKSTGNSAYGRTYSVKRRCRMEDMLNSYDEEQ